MSGPKQAASIRSGSGRVLWIASCVAFAFCCLPEVGRAQETNGRIDGRLIRADGSGVVGATVLLAETRATDFTDADGQFSFDNLPAGVYSVTLTLGERVLTIRGVQVTGGASTTLEEIVDWVRGFTETLIVRGASRQVERIVEAPASATLVAEEDIERKASHGQLPKLLEYTPGAQVVQGGLWDFNMGTRGFNRTLSRRVAVLLDGRDLALPFFGYQGWPAFSFPLDDLSGVELVRGPSAALYGANASGGVITMTSKEPRFSLGGLVRVAFGEWNTFNLEGRWTGALGDGWYARTVGGVRRSDGFAVPRVTGPEYSAPCDVGTFGDCLPAEGVSFDGEDAQVFFGGVRLDKYASNDLLITLEAGHAEGGFGVFQAAGQRVKSTGRDGKRPWARFNLNGDRFNLAASYDGYIAGFTGLTTATPFNSDSSRFQVEAQTNRHFRQDTIQVVVGATAGVENMDSFNPAVGAQTFLFRPITSKKQALFAQTSWSVTKEVKLLLAARGDWNSLHRFQVSPRTSVTYSVTPDQSVRFTYNRAFQVSNSLEYFLNIPVAPPADLGALNGFCTPFGVDCRFGPTPVLALGNEDLAVESVNTWEAGYKGIFGDRLLLTLDYYRNGSSNFVTSLLPQLGTALGRLNPDFGPWQAPVGLPGEVADQIRTLVPLLSNHLDGSNILAAASYTNFRKITSRGFDLGVTGFLPAGWRTFVTYSWFDFRVPDAQPGTENLVLPNAPAHAFSMGLAYDRNRIGAGVDVRWVDDFRWADGFFLGDVASFTSVDVTATYPLSTRVSVGLNVSNVFNDRHWETFGGALVKRRALLSLQYGW